MDFDMKKIICSLFSLYFFLSALAMNPAFAQDGDDFVKSTQNDLMLVAGAGAAGAVLGLSTLSFADKPSRHVSNIWTGAALGVIVGVVFVAYNSAQRGSEELQSSSEFNSNERLAWHDLNNQNLTMPSVQFGTQFWQTSF
jgi:hypothetical protein